MTKPQTEAERMASEYEATVKKQGWASPETAGDDYLAGFKAAVAKAEKMEFKAHYSLGDCSPCVLIADLKALLEPKS